jgi:hypothetical protein
MKSILASITLAATSIIGCATEPQEPPIATKNPITDNSTIAPTGFLAGPMELTAVLINCTAAIPSNVLATFLRDCQGTTLGALLLNPVFQASVEQAVINAIGSPVSIAVISAVSPTTGLVISTSLLWDNVSKSLVLAPTNSGNEEPPL